MKFKRFFLYLVASLTFLYISICAYMYIIQRDILYQPNVIHTPLVEKLNTQVKEIEVLSTDNVNLKSWFYKNNKNKYTILFLHGNNGNLKTRIYKLNEFKNLNLKSKDFTLCTEIPIKIKIKNYKYISIPSYERSRLGGKKKVNEITDGFLILSYLLIKFFIF